MENIDHAAKIRAAIDAVFNPERHSPEEFPISERWDLPPGCCEPKELEDRSVAVSGSNGINESESSYSLDVKIIRDMFDPKHYTNGEITLELVMQRLALIDLFYSTNLNRYTQFGLYDVADKILKFGSDNALANDARSFVKQPSTNHPINQRLFVGKYGYPGTHAVSIISKYLFFLLEAQKCKIGFPIYDSMVKDLLPKVAKKLGVTTTANGTKINSTSVDDIVKFVDSINTVAQAIGIQQRIHNGRELSQFAVFDYFLWRIGKVGDLSYSLLLTENELSRSGIVNAIERIKKAANNTSKKQQLSPQFIASILPLIAQLPGRFLLWYCIYLSI